MDGAVRGDERNVVLVVTGELDAVAAVHVRSAAFAAVPEDAAFDLDASGVTFVDAGGLRVLHELQLRSRGRLRLVGRSPQLDRLLQLAELAELF